MDPGTREVMRRLHREGSIKARSIGAVASDGLDPYDPDARFYPNHLRHLRDDD